MSVSFGGSIWTQLAFRAKTISKRLGRSLETWNALDVLLIPLEGASSCAEVPGLGLDKWGRLQRDLSVELHSQHKNNSKCVIFLSALEPTKAFKILCFYRRNETKNQVPMHFRKFYVATKLNSTI